MDHQRIKNQESRIKNCPLSLPSRAYNEFTMANAILLSCAYPNHFHQATQGASKQLKPWSIASYVPKRRRNIGACTNSVTRPKSFSWELAGRVRVCCVSHRRREGRGKEEVKGRVCTPCALVGSASCGGAVCEEAEEDGERVRYPFYFYFVFLNGVCLYTTLHYTCIL